MKNQLQIKTLIAYLIITISALVMNLSLFEWRYALFPALLLIFPLLVFPKIEFKKVLQPTKEGAKLFVAISFIVVLLFPCAYLAYFSVFIGKSLTTPNVMEIYEAVKKGLLLTFLVAFPEEFFFRAFIQETALKKHDRKFFFIITRKNMVTSILFGACHAISFLNITRGATFFPSLLFGWLTEKSGGRIFYPILFHAISNILVFVLATFVKW